MISLAGAGTARFVLVRLAAVQVGVALLGAGLGLALYGAGVAKAMLAGGMVALTNALMLGWRMRTGRRDLHQDAHRHLRAFYRSSLERFFIVGLLLVAGLGPLSLKPAPLLAGFVMGQLALMFSLFIRKTK